MPTPLEPLTGFLAEVFRQSGPVTEDAALAARCADHVTGNARLTPAEQIDIYRRQYWLRHLGSLAEDYPALEAILGKPPFESFCRAYLEFHPPASRMLRDLGEHIVAFADGYREFPEGLEEIARELVRFEHAFIDVFDGPEPPPLDPAKVQAMPEEGWSTARIVLHPLLRRMNFKYPVQEVRAGVRAGGVVGVPERREVRLILFRKGVMIHWQEVDAVAYALLGEIAAGQPLVPACEAVANGLDEEAVADLGERVQRWFAQWTSWGIIVDIEPAKLD